MWIAPGVSAESWWSLVVATVLVAAVSWALRPALAAFARRFGWVGAAVDFAPTNTFTNIARCEQTLPRPMSMPCPASPPCP